MEKTYVKWAKRYRLYISQDERLKTWIRRMVPGLGRGLRWPSPPDPRASPYVGPFHSGQRWPQKNTAHITVCDCGDRVSHKGLCALSLRSLSPGEKPAATPHREDPHVGGGRGGAACLRPAPATWAGHPGERPSAQPQGFGGLQPPHGGLWPAPSGQVTPRFLTLGNRVR